jgi:hypothetical protein
MPQISSGTVGGLIHLESRRPGDGLAHRALLRAAPAALVGPQPVGVDLSAGQSWQNYGMNLKEPKVARQFYVWNDPGNGTKDWHAGLSNLSWVVNEAFQNQYQLRPAGQTWSFSPCVDTADTIVDVRALSMSMPDLQAADLATLPPESLAHLQSGTIIDQVNRRLEASQRCVYTMGGNAGQTLGGALATGTHGGFWQRPPIGDYVRAMTLVTEAGPLWLEPSGNPLTSPSFNAWGAFQVKRDDALFNAARVSLGCLGVVFSVVLEARPLVYLFYTRATQDYDDALRRALFDNDLSQLSLPRPGLPDHFEVVLNPYQTGPGQRGAHVTTYYDVPSSTPIVAPGSGITLNWGMIVDLLQAAAQDPKTVPSLVNFVMPILYGDSHAVGPFSLTTPVSTMPDVPTISMEIAIPRGDLKTVLPFILQQIQTEQANNNFYIPGPLGIRFTQAGTSDLAFTSFGPTATIEFPCLGGVAGTTDFFDRMLAALTKSGQRFHPHWGQYFHPDPAYAQSYPGFASWKQARAALLPNQSAVFRNNFTDQLGLT